MPDVEHNRWASTRIKRNAACCNCRDAKVRCNPALGPNEPCQRCKKHGVSCVVDKTHRRVSRKSKLDELVQEIQTIKQTVGNGTERMAPSAVPQTWKDHGPRLGMASPSTSSAVASGTQVASSGSSNAAPVTPATTLTQDTPPEPSLPRALHSLAVSGEDIDYYFQKFFEHFHPLLPIVRQRDPNKCYEACPLLFWTIIYIASRRYARTSGLLAFLTDSVQKETYTVFANGPLTLPSLNAIILICGWAFPDVRFAKDPSYVYSGSCMYSCLALGLHTGKGQHSDYSFGPFNANISSEEASFTWAGYNIISQRLASATGFPALGCLFNQAIQNVIDGNTSFHVPSSFRVLLECQKFCNHVNRTMAACLEEARGVSAHVVRLMEEEWDTIRGVICSGRAHHLDRLNALLVQMEIQLYYLIPLPGYDPEGLKRHILRTYNTARTVLREALELDLSTNFLHHIPHFYLKSLFCAMCVVYKVLRSSYINFLDREIADQAGADALAICKRASVMEEDLPTRLGWLMGQWTDHSRSTHGQYWQDEPVSSFTGRLSAGIIYDCLHRWKRERESTSNVSGKQVSQSDGGGTATGAETSDNNNNNMFEALPFDWSFMDGFDWDFQSDNILNPQG